MHNNLEVLGHVRSKLGRRGAVRWSPARAQATSPAVAARVHRIGGMGRAAEPRDPAAAQAAFVSYLTQSGHVVAALDQLDKQPTMQAIQSRLSAVSPVYEVLHR